MSADLMTTTLQETVDIIEREYIDPLESIPGSMINAGIVRVETIPFNTGGQRRVKEVIQTDEYSNVKVEDGQISQARIATGYAKDIFSRTFAKQITVSLEFRTQSKNKKEIFDRLTNLAHFNENRKDLDLSMFISYGQSTSYVDKDGLTNDISTGDGLAPFSPVHTLTQSTTTYRNILSPGSALSVTALEQMEQLAITEAYNNFGEQMHLKFNKLFTTRNQTQVNIAREVLQATAKIAAPNAGVTNVYQGKYEHIILDRIDMSSAGIYDTNKKKFWGIISDRDFTLYHMIFMPNTFTFPSSGNNGEDINTMSWIYNTATSYGNALAVGRGILFSPGDGSVS